MSEYDQDLPISEQYRLIAKRWCDAQAAASIMEETKSAFVSQITAKIIG